LKDCKDVLRFVSAPLTKPVTITGKVWAHLHFASDAPDTWREVSQLAAELPSAS
jgi:hypothetical protein